jgi:hypothetical protein
MVAARPTRLMPMADSLRSDASAVFAEMLAKNKRRFDDLSARGRSQGNGAPAAVAAPADRPSATALSSREGARSLPLDSQSAAVRRLNARFGNEWRYEIADQQRDGDEAIVLVKLTVGKEGAIRSQFGRAKISEGSVSGASGDVHFKSGAGDLERDGGDAFRRAAEAALMNCADLI